MPPSAPEPGQYKHITFTREPKKRFDDRKTRQNPGAPKAPIREDRHQHAQEILQELTQATQQVLQARKGYGIDPEQLFVLEFNSTNINLRETFERFGAWVVSEFRDKVADQDHYRLLVQFPTETSRQLLSDENRLYDMGATENTVLAPVMRQNFFAALESVRSVSREERTGVRLQEEGFPDAASFYLDVDLWHPGDRDSVQKFWVIFAQCALVMMDS
jgi:hypothetical protein